MKKGNHSKATRGKPQPNLVDRHKEKDLRSGEKRSHGAGSGSRRDGVSESRGHGGECRSTGGKKGGGEEELHFDYCYFLVILKENRNYVVVVVFRSPILFSLSLIARITITTKNKMKIRILSLAPVTFSIVFSDLVVVARAGGTIAKRKIFFAVKSRFRGCEPSNNFLDWVHDSHTFGLPPQQRARNFRMCRACFPLAC